MMPHGITGPERVNIRLTRLLQSAILSQCHLRVKLQQRIRLGDWKCIFKREIKKKFLRNFVQNILNKQLNGENRLKVVDT
jgi:hypothetical protein